MAKKETGWNPTLLDLLKEGARVTFQDGLWISGDPATKAINVSLDYIQNAPSWGMNEAGLKKALQAIMEDREESERRTTG